MQLRSVCLSATLLASLSVPAFAQRAGTIELGAFGRYTWYDNSYQLEDNIGVGGHLGFFAVRNIEIEAAGSFNPTSFTFAGTRKSHQIALHGRLLYNQPVGQGGAFILGGGITHNIYKGDADGNETGPGGLVGVRMGMGETISIRLDGTVDYFSTPNEQLSTAKDGWHWGLQVGISALTGNRRRAAAPAPAPAPAPVAPADADQDGVADGADRCPGTPAGEQVDANGCSASQRDTDNDGVKDNLDKCANTPAGDKVDANGCTLPKDADTDGVADDKDQCANTPAGEQVDANGCGPSQRDTDNDGVKDDKDRCPNTASGERVDANGCRVLFEEGGKKSLVLQGVNFATGKAELLPESQTILKDVAASLAANSEIRVEVQGHTDNTGSLATNRRLSAARANAVREFLVANGVSADRLVSKGYGPSKPIASNRTADGRAQNRRVELLRLN